MISTLIPSVVSLTLFSAVVVIASDHPHPGSDDKLTLDQRLVVACFDTDVDEVAELLRQGANANTTFGPSRLSHFQDSVTGATPLNTASWTPLMALSFPVLVSKKTERNINGSRIMIDALRPEGVARALNRLAVCRLLYSHGCQLNATNSSGKTALHYAAEGNSVELAKLLVDLGASPNIQSTFGFEVPAGRTALHGAAGSTELSEYLISRGAKDDLKDMDGNTPIMLREKFKARRIDRERNGDRSDRIDPFAG